MSTPTIHVGTTIRRRLPNGDQVEHTVNWSGIPATSGQGLYDLMRQTSEMAIGEQLDLLQSQFATGEEAALSSSLPAKSPAAVPPLIPNLSHETENETTDEEAAREEADQGDAEGMVSTGPDLSAVGAPVTSPAKDAAPVPTIPRVSEVLTGIDVFDVTVPFPVDEEIGQPITLEQVKAVNAVLAALGYKGMDRHPAMNAWLEAYEAPPILSIKDLSVSQARAFLTWHDLCDDSAKIALREAIEASLSLRLPMELGESVASAARELLEANRKEALPVPLTIPETLEAAQAIITEAGLTQEEMDDWDPFDDTKPDAHAIWEAIKIISNARKPVDSGSELVFSASQRAAIDAIEGAIGQPRFLFVTGKAGTGKSTILRHIRSRHRGVLVMAPTGLAALNVQGITIHRAFRFPIGFMQSGKVKRPSGYVADALEAARVIVIDEVSMVRADLMDGIDVALRKLMKTDTPFGGKTVVAIGDMMQLAPVVGDGEKEAMEAHYASEFWFDAHCLGGSTKGLIENQSSVVIERYELTDVFRQRDQQFVDALNLIRDGSAKGLEYLNARASVPVPSHVPTLCFTNKKAGASNDAMLARLPGDVSAYLATVDGEWPESEQPAPLNLFLKVGARVMVTKNLVDVEAGDVANGTMGTVLELHEGRVRVALDRGAHIDVTPAVWTRQTAAVDLKTREVTMVPAGEYMQIPLRLAWAITIHKSQGQTLEAACIEADGRAFAHGQVYVGLSRVKSLDGLYLRRQLSARDLIVHSRVAEWLGLPSAAVAPALPGLGEVAA